MTDLNDYLRHKEDALSRRRTAVERTCPLLNLLRNPQRIRGSLDHRAPAGADVVPLGSGTRAA